MPQTIPMTSLFLLPKYVILSLWFGHLLENALIAVNPVLEKLSDVEFAGKRYGRARKCINFISVLIVASNFPKGVSAVENACIKLCGGENLGIILLGKAEELLTDKATFTYAGVDIQEQRLEDMLWNISLSGKNFIVSLCLMDGIFIILTV